ncbi:MAG: hypothetical protein IT438_01845 [Phycisphaerales bacterium]|nr:hypothetical protein [Phycisphaerales bacterium]
MRPNTRLHSQFRSVSLVLSAASLAASVSVTAAVMQPRSSTQIGGQITEVQGRSFDGVRLPSPQVESDLTFAGGRVWVWEEREGARGASAAMRLLLRGDVRVSFAGHNFTAAQASVWIEQLADPADTAPASPDQPVVRTRQIAIYFDRVNDPSGDAGGQGFSQAGDRLLVTGILRGELALKYDSVVRARPERVDSVESATFDFEDQQAAVRDAAAFVVESEHRLARHLRKLLGEVEPEDAQAPELTDARRNPGAYSPLRPIRPGVSRPYEPNSAIARAADNPGLGPPSPQPLPPVERLEPIFGKDGLISLAVNGDRMIGTGGPEDDVGSPIKFILGQDAQESVLMLSGGVVVQYTPAKARPGIEITATRAVVFLKNGADPAGSMNFGTDSIKGIYLEGDVVAVSGGYTLRGPRVYYDIENQQAVMPEAVFWTYDAERGLPLYVRARTIRQLSDKQWQAEGARLSTTSFTDPVFAIGAKSVTITQRERPSRRSTASAFGGQVPGSGAGGGSAATRPGDATFVDARGVTLQGGGLPLMYLPRFKGEVADVPLTDVRFENSNQSGSAIKTAWDVFSVSGLEAPEGVQSEALIDWYFDRGPGLGSQNKWERTDHKGGLFAYTVPIDWGRDVLSSGAKKDRAAGGEFRGVLLGEDTWRLSERWTLQTEVGVASDENVIDAFFRPIAEEGREVTNSAYIKRQDDWSLFTGLVKGAINDFTPNHYLLESQGYTVDKLPEFAYFRAGDDLLPQSSPGSLTWSSEYRLTNMRLSFTEPTLRELGFDNPTRALGAFGVSNPNLSPADVLRAQGYTEDAVLRGDTRQEFVGTFTYGPIKFSPFINGRFTAYDQKFEEFNSGAGIDDQYRYLYAGGVRTSTQLVRIDDDLDSSFFDLHRTRHIIEPNVTAWYAGTNVQQSDLPVYDDPVESLATGSSIKAAIDQTWQTQRGGPGRWRSVDVLKLDAAIVGSTDDVDKESPILRFFDYRPEYSQLGNFGSVAAAWQATDALALTADTIYDLDINQPARTSAGGLIQHNPDLSSYAEVRYINALDSTYVDFGCNYSLTRRYLVGFNASYDTDEDEFQSLNLNVRRKTPEAAVGVSVGVNNITDETSIGVIFEPTAAREAQRPTDRLRNIGR